MSNEQFTQYLEYLFRVRRLSAHTVSAYARDLNLFERWLQHAQRAYARVTVSDMRLFVCELGRRGLSAASINRVLSVVRGFYVFAKKKHWCADNPARLVRNIKGPSKLPRFMFPPQAKAFYTLPSRTDILWQERDAALFAMLYSTGCRVSEIAALSLKDVHPHLSSAIVRGKGDRERTVFIAPFAQNFLHVYMQARAQRCARYASCTPALFVNQRGRSLSVRGIQYLVSRYVLLAQDVHALSPHAFRHSFASTLIRRGADVRVAQELLGHASVSTTQRYVHVTSEQLQDLYHRAHPRG